MKMIKRVFNVKDTKIHNSHHGQIKMDDIRNTALQLSKIVGVELFELCNNISALLIKTELWAFVDKERSKSLYELARDEKLKSIALPAETTIVRFVVDDGFVAEQESISLGLGYEGVSLKLAIHKILDLPDTFQES
ncbi:hypothetical protein, partial [Pseudomonas brassicacearum]